MIGGVSFQPGGAETDPTRQKSPQTGVQEAIRVLSLRLPKTVGARAVAPGALLNAQGSGGNPRVDSVVNQVLGRYFPSGDASAAGGPGGAPGGAMAPMIASGAPPGGGYGGSFSPGEIPGNTPLSEFFGGGARRDPRITVATEQRGGPSGDPTNGTMPVSPPQRFDVNPPARPSTPPPSITPPAFAPPNPGDLDGQPVFGDAIGPPPAGLDEEMRRRNTRPPSLEELFSPQMQI